VSLECVENVSGRDVDAERLRNDHAHGLGHEAVIVDRGKWNQASAEEVAERTKVVFSHDRLLESGKPRLELGLTLRALTALGIALNAEIDPLPLSRPEAASSPPTNKRTRARDRG
jgi:hypothetical protein